MKKLEHLTEPELRDLMTAMGHGIEAVAAILEVERPLFVLVLFNDPKVGQYVANCVREDVIKAMRETADRLEHNEDLQR